MTSEAPVMKKAGKVYTGTIYRIRGTNCKMRDRINKYRGTVYKIICTIYENYDGWILTLMATPGKKNYCYKISPLDSITSALHSLSKIYFNT